MRPRVIASTAPLLLSPVDWVLDAVAEAGFAGAELLLAHNPDTRDPARVASLAERAGIEIPAIHGPYMLVLRRVLGRDYVAKSRASLEVAAELGAEAMVAHGPFRWERRALRWAAGEAADEAAELGVAFGMENLFPLNGRRFSAVVTPDDLAPFRHVVFDTSHFAVTGVDLFAAWEQLADRVVGIHVSDNFGNQRDSHAPVGAGVLPLEAFLAHVGRSGYAGTVTLELDCRPYLDTRAALVGFLRDQRERVEAMLAGTAVGPAGDEAGAMRHE